MGSLLVRGTALWKALLPGTSGRVLKTAGPSALPAWGTLATTDLSDVSSGTFTPGMTINGSATGITFSAASGVYTRIGKLVFAQWDVSLSSKGASVGAVLITALPFTGVSPTGNSSVLFSSGMNATINWQNFVSGTTIALGKVGATGWSSLADTDLTNTSRIAGQAIYLIA